MSDTAAGTMPAWSLADDCARLRDLARKHGFMIRARDAKEVWQRRSKLARSTWLPLPEADEVLFSEFIKPLHEWLADDVEQVSAADELPPEAKLGRPALIDEFQDGPCDICAAWAARRGQRDEDGRVIVLCEGCGERVPDMPSNGGRGIQGTVPHHFHVKMVNGSIPGRQGVYQELCLDCAIALRLKVYPPDEKNSTTGAYWPTEEQMRSYRG